MFLHYLENVIRWCVVGLTNLLPVKVIRDDDGRPFLYRYYLFSWGNNGPGLCIHHFIKSDPDRGYHDHPWKNGLSFILSGGYEERILALDRSASEARGLSPLSKVEYNTFTRSRWSFNHLDGEENFHRVMIPEGGDAWTIFGYTSRSKTWGMIDLEGKYHAMSDSIEDKDGGWWNHVGNGYALNNRVPLKKPVIATVDIIVTIQPEGTGKFLVLLVKRGKEPFKGQWAFPGGRVEGSDADLEAAAYRELREETNFTPKSPGLKYLMAVGNGERDPRGFTISHIYTCFLGNGPKPSGIKAGDDAVDYQWWDLNELPEMAFDHKQILLSYSMDF